MFCRGHPGRTSRLLQGMLFEIYTVAFVRLLQRVADAKLYRGPYVLGWHDNHKGTKRLPLHNFHRDFICLNKCWIKAQTHP